MNELRSASNGCKHTHAAITYTDYTSYVSHTLVTDMRLALCKAPHFQVIRNLCPHFLCSVFVFGLGRRAIENQKQQNQRLGGRR